MIKIYGMETCPDCTYVEEQVKGNNQYEVIDIGQHVRDLKAFLRLRYHNPAFNEAKSINLVFKNDVQRNQAIEQDRKKRSEKNIHDLERKIIANNENYRFESERHTCRLNDIELNYLAKLNANESRFKAINKETHSSLMKNKQKYFDIFNACDQNSNHIISTIIKDNTNMKRNFAINLNLLEKKYSFFILFCKLS